MKYSFLFLFVSLSPTKALVSPLASLRTTKTSSVHALSSIFNAENIFSWEGIHHRRV